MNLQEKIDEAYPRYYDYEGNITKEQWQEMLQNPSVFYESNIEHLKCIYTFENHAATCKEVSEKLGNTPNHYIGLANALAKRIVKKMEIKKLPTKDDSEADVYWYILFYGQEVNNHFEWKLRPELAKALKELYPDLEYPEPAIFTKLKDVASSVWLATVLLTYETFKRTENPKKEMLYFKQSDIQKKAQQLCTQNVDNARISQWCNADHDNHTYKYLREGEDTTRRISFHGEFNGFKEQPNLDLENHVQTSFGIKTVEEMKKFVQTDYTALWVQEETNVGGDALMKNKNMILYGPPGTGKTYHTVNYAVSIIENRPLEEVQKEEYAAIYEKYLSYKSVGRIAFTTFHQSYGYEEFIEGIKPVINKEEDDAPSEIQYEYASGVFKRFCEKAKEVKVQTSSLKIRENPVIWNVLLGGTGQTDLKKDCFLNDYIKIGWAKIEKTVTDETEGINQSERRILLNFQEEMQEGDIVFIQKNNTSIDGIGVIAGPYEYDETAEKYPRTRKVQWIKTDIDEKVYEMNKQTKLDRKTVYPLRNIDLKKGMALVEKYAQSGDLNIEENQDPYVFIIDEINRGNISKIFGELITLIESTKRLGEDEAATAILPYTSHEFGVPKNVYILGTMNTADRSISLMDTALRRRFHFIEMMPDENILTKLGIGDVEGIDVPKMLRTINDRIEYLYDREHTIGHAYFTSLAKNPTLENLAGIFLNAILPLLQEYFYEDYRKIQLVLGDNAKENPDYKFILDQDIKVRKVFKGNPDIDDLPETKYSIQKSAFYQPESYKLIY